MVTVPVPKLLFWMVDDPLRVVDMEPCHRRALLAIVIPPEKVLFAFPKFGVE